MQGQHRSAKRLYIKGLWPSAGAVRTSGGLFLFMQLII